MSISGNSGFYGVATQVDKDTFNSAGPYTWFEATEAPFQIQEVARTRRPTIGDSPFPRGAYKAGVSFGSVIGLELTPSAPGQLLYYTMGDVLSSSTFVYVVDVSGVTGDFSLDVGGVETTSLIPQTNPTVEDFYAAIASAGEDTDNYVVFYDGATTFYVYDVVGDATVAAGATNGNGVVVSAGTTHYGHIFRPLSTDKYFLPYFSIIRGVGGQVQERGRGAKIQTATIAFAAGDAVQGRWTILGIEPGQDSSSVTPTYDDGVVMTMISNAANISLDINGNVYDASNIDVLSATFEANNMLTPPDRYKIGSKYPIDFTCLDRTARMTMNLEISDDTLYNEIHYTGAGVWKDVPALGSFRIVAANSDATPAQLAMRASNVFFTGMLIANEPRRVVQAQLTAEVLRNTSGVDMQFELMNTTASYS